MGVVQELVTIGKQNVIAGTAKDNQNTNNPGPAGGQKGENIMTMYDMYKEENAKLEQQVLELSSQLAEANAKLERLEEAVNNIVTYWHTRKNITAQEIDDLIEKLKQSLTPAQPQQCNFDTPDGCSARACYDRETKCNSRDSKGQPKYK